jgi:hypothetical protein
VKPVLTVNSDRGSFAQSARLQYADDELGARVKTFRQIAPWLLLGPITGFLMAGVYRNASKHEPILTSLYGLALIVTWYDFAAWTGQAIGVLHGIIR